MAQDKDSLRDIDLLEGLPPADLDALARRCAWRRFAAGQEIVGYMDETRDVFFIVGGRVRAVIYSAAGKEVTFRDIGAGQVFGEFSAIDGNPRSANIVALDDSVIAAMPASVFWQVLTDHPEVAAAVLKSLIGQLRALSDRVFEFSTLAVKNRIHAELLRLARDHMRDDNTAVVAPAPTHSDIASRISTHREAVTRELSELARAGLVKRRRGALEICDVPRLARLVEEVVGE